MKVIYKLPGDKILKESEVANISNLIAILNWTYRVTLNGKEYSASGKILDASNDTLIIEVYPVSF